MAIEVEDGTSKTDSDSYISVADADTYLAIYTTRTDWDSATTANKEIALKRATQYLDNMYGARWKGIRSDEDQALDWPRYGVTDHDGYGWDSDEMPTELLNATCEIADRIIDGDNPMADQSDTSTIRKQKVKAGPVEEEVEYAGSMTLGKKYPTVEALLSPLITGANMVQLHRT